MNIKLVSVTGLSLVMLSAAAAIAPACIAQETDDTIPLTIPEAATDLLTSKSGNFFENRSIARQAGNIFGFSFPERQIEWDVNTFSTEFQGLMRLQNTSDPTIRVPDLANPYTTTLLTMPSSNAPAVGTEFIFE